MERLLVPTVAWCSMMVLAAYAIATGTPALRHNADSLIPVFVSLEGWTLFYWGQDRFGMLLPLLTIPVTDGFWNLVGQNALSTTLLLAGCTAAFARCGARRPPLCALLLVTALIAFSAGEIRLLLFTTNQSYAPALGCFGVALYLCRRARVLPTAGAAALMIVGAWVNGGVALLAAVTALMFVAVRATRAASLPLLIGAVLSLVAHRALQAMITQPLLDTTTVVQPAMAMVPALTRRFWSDAYRVAGGAYWSTTLIAWAAALYVASRHSRERRDYAGLVALALAVLIYGTGMALFLRGAGRHIAPVLPLLLAAPIVVVASSRLYMPSTAPVAFITLGLLLAQTGLELPASTRRKLIDHFGDGREFVFYSEGVRVITGDYWSVWPLTFATNLLYERDTGQRPVLPVAMRSEILTERRRAHLQERAIVAVVPAGDLRYWHSYPDLPRLAPKSETNDYTLSYVDVTP